MTQQQIELHEQFIKGITAKMLGLAAFGIMTVVSSFWVGYFNLKKSISDGNVNCQEQIKSVRTESKYSRDSVQNLNEQTHIKMWNAIKDKRSGFLTETRDKNGIHVHNDN
jgi:hypothetical protein